MMLWGPQNYIVTLSIIIIIFIFLIRHTLSHTLVQGIFKEKIMYNNNLENLKHTNH